jgi:hypothetical protein
MSIDLVAMATEIEKILADIATVIKALPPPTDPAAQAALNRVKATLPTPAAPPTGAKTP